MVCERTGYTLRILFHLKLMDWSSLINGSLKFDCTKSISFEKNICALIYAKKIYIKII